MRRLESKLFYFLLKRVAKRNIHNLSLPNGLMFLLRNNDFDIVMKSSRELRKTYEPLRKG